MARGHTQWGGEGAGAGWKRFMGERSIYGILSTKKIFLKKGSLSKSYVSLVDLVVPLWTTLSLR